jgi:Ni/Fe-hydrogenase subunit HybB-like protein
MPEKFVTAASFSQINEGVLKASEDPGVPYRVVVTLLAMCIGTGSLIWLYQILTGMGVAGISHPVGWATYIGNFVFWVGIAHSGTLISAILYLVRARWRGAVSRSAEAMTIFAIMTAGLFPLVHLGRDWAAYYILPYPSQRTIWPNFMSPLVWDVCAVGTYFTVSCIFFFVGLIPDVAAGRDRALEKYGQEDWRYKLYNAMSLGWSGAGAQWRHYGRSYLYFAALATPLVISVHSVVSWDFAMGLLPGWHSTIFAPYFVAGAIHSGLAMVLTLLIPMRKLLNLEDFITIDHFEAVAKTILVTSCIVGYAYVVEPYMAFYSGDIFEKQFEIWRATGEPLYMFWLIIPFNVLIPLLFVFRKIRRSLPWLFAISIIINIGMWLERLMIVFSATSHDFMPHNWGPYHPTWVEYSITAAAFTFFFFWFLVFSKVLPTIPISDVKKAKIEEKEDLTGKVFEDVKNPERSLHTVLAVFPDAESLVKAIRDACSAGFKKLDFFSPTKLEEAERALGYKRSPVRFWTLAGALSGAVGGYALAIYAATLNNLIVGGKPPVAWIPYAIVSFEGTILLGSIFNFIGMIVHTKLYRSKTVRRYDRRFSNDKFGLVIACTPETVEAARAAVAEAGPEEIHVNP